MKRRALIIVCTDTGGDILYGPIADGRNAVNLLTSRLGGHWISNEEIKVLHNPTIREVRISVRSFLAKADYSFVLFSGHGFIDPQENNDQFLELLDYNISIRELVTRVKRQTIIIDACRGKYSPIAEEITKGLGEIGDVLTGDPYTTRQIFDRAVLSCEEGISVLYSASQNESAIDSPSGGAYFYSLMKTCERWGLSPNNQSILNLREAHELSISYMHQRFITTQNPTMNSQKRYYYFPLAVKYTSINS